MRETISEAIHHRDSGAASGQPAQSAEPADPRRHPADRRDRDRHLLHYRQLPATRDAKQRARAAKHRAAADPAFRPRARLCRSGPARPHSAHEADRHRHARSVQAPDLRRGCPRHAAKPGQRRLRHGPHQHLRCRWAIDQFFGFLAGSADQHRRPRLLQAIQDRSEFARGRDRAGAQPFRQGLDHGDRAQGRRTERQAAGGRLARHVAGQLRDVLPIAGARRGRRDLDAASRRHDAGALSAHRAR